MIDLSGGRAASRTLALRRWSGLRSSTEQDAVVTEEPLQITLDGAPLTVVMRTPGQDVQLALGLLHNEALIGSLSEVAGVRVAASGQLEREQSPVPLEWLPLEENIIDIQLAAPIDLDRAGWQRRLLSASGCGVCGATTIEALRHEWPPAPVAETISATVLYELPARLRAAQTLFSVTGGLHAAGLFTVDGELRWLHEDVGRHNAVDKVIGSALLAGQLPLPGTCLMLSGRAGFELVQKAAAARIPIVASVSAPSSLAVSLAQEFGITLVGFVRSRGMNCYAVPERVVGA